MPTPEENAIIREQERELHERYSDLGYDDVVSYYPPQMEAERDRFAIAITSVDGSQLYQGDHDYRFPLHSISKVFTYALALEDNGRAETLKRVGVEPSGDAFNSLVFDRRNNRPFNPMVNAGALVTTNLVHGTDRDEKVERLLERLRRYTGNPDLDVDERTRDAELHTYSDRNLGLSYLMRSLGMLVGDVHDNIDTYLSVCSVRVDARELATMGATLANGGVNPVTGERALPRAHVRDVVTVMMTCGMYDAAGEWAYDVGIPAKSAVSGAIMAAMPNTAGGGFFSPGLDVHGNSVRAIAVCRDLSEHYGLHVFADPAEDRLGQGTIASEEPSGTTR
jgi:glutaminase